MAVSVASPSFWGVDGIAPKRGLFHVSRPFSVANASTERAAARGQSLDRRVASRSILDRSSICERHRPAPGPRERNDHQEVVCWQNVTRQERRAGGRRQLWDHAERSIQADTPAMAMLALHSAVRLGAAARVVDRLTELLVPMQGPLPGPIGAHARGAADRDGPALLTVADGFARLGFLPYGAEAAAQAAEIFAAQQGPGSAAARRATARATELSLR
jgi:hypothetical protein